MRACTLPGRGGGGTAAALERGEAYGPLGTVPGDGALGKGVVMAFGLFVLSKLGVRRSATTGASFHPPFSRRLGGGASGGADIGGGPALLKGL